jgi:lysophospholipase L1-like esterase
MRDGSGGPISIERVTTPVLSADQLAQYAGEYRSDEAEAGFAVRVRDGKLELTQRPDTVHVLAPLYEDAFDSELGTILFRLDDDRVASFSVVQDRVWDLRFQREFARKRVLVFGDSNTWGWIPVKRGYPTTRYAAEARWPGVAQAALGERYAVIEEALNGRTTDLADPAVPELPGAGLDGSAYLPAAIASHLPLDLVVIMLGTNDLKTTFDRSPEEIAQGIRRLVDIVGAQDRAAWTEYPAPYVLVVAPPPMRRTERFPAPVFANGIEKSAQLAGHYEAVARAAGVAYLDAGGITPADGVDGLHLSAEAHRRLGLAIADKIRAILE